nr:MFS transporter [Dysgonomonas sp. 216]
MYIAQAIPMSFFTTVVPVIMRQENYSLESIGLLQLVKLPWILKFLWAPLVDKKANTLSQYKKWIITSEVFYALIILSIGAFSLQANFNLIVVLIVIAVIASATQDIATDALAILSLKKDQHSMGNAVQSAGGFIGALIGSGLLLLIYHTFGWFMLLVGLSCFVLLAVIPLLFFRYPLRPKPMGINISGKDIVRFFTQKGIFKYVVFLLLSYSGLSGMLAMLKPYMFDNKYDLEQIGFISGILGTSMAALFAFVAGLLIKKVGLRKMLQVIPCLGIFVGVYFYVMNNSAFSDIQLIIGVCALWATYGMMNVAIFVMAMNKSRLGLEGTDFTLQIVVTQFGSLLIAGLSGFVSQRFTYQGLFIMEIVLSLITILYVYLLYRNKKIDALSEKTNT